MADTCISIRPHYRYHAKTTSPPGRLPLFCACLLALGPFSLTAAAAASGVDAPIRTTQNANNASAPLFRYQWHLLNQGQPVFGNQRPWPSVDLDVDILHTLGIRGAGVKLVVSMVGLRLGTRISSTTSLPAARITS
ncbi:hypothetical protein XAV_14450 [Xanthomonas axonopodis pv. vasculorum]|nr:hypothetical protein XAV_14450 [Xanthomonas axonopodis pv. vasculorum]